MTNTIQATLAHASTQLKAHLLEPESGAYEANLLLMSLLNVNRAWLIAHQGDALSASTYLAFETLIIRRLGGEPIAYILGEREFFGLRLKVTPDTLIPRPDTETLVETALAKIPTDSSPSRILDLGTGTGAIALAIAINRPYGQITAVYASAGALKVAQDNALNLQISNVEFILSNWFDALAGKTFDVIVSNPPYIEADDAHLNQGDVRFEPRTALVSGKDGLDDIRHIINHAVPHLRPQGWLMFEHGYNQAHAVATLLAQAGFQHIESIKDLGGNDRVTLGQFVSGLHL